VEFEEVADDAQVDESEILEAGEYDSDDNSEDR
jgi:hypothetical protein